jgi:hypothetical protein
MFVRFVTKTIDKDSGRRQGLFQAGKALRENGILSAEDLEHLERILAWFNEHLERPKRLTISKRSNRKAQAISWLRDTATEHIAKMREFQRVLERNGVSVEMIKAERLGYVLYEDEFQVAAYPFSDTPT